MSVNSISLETVNSNVMKTNAIKATQPVSELNQVGHKGEYDRNTKQAIKAEIEEANHSLQMNNRRCEFRFVDDVNRIAIKVIDTDTDEVIKEIPSEEVLETIKRLKEMTGLLIDKQL